SGSRFLKCGAYLSKPRYPPSASCSVNVERPSLVLPHLRFPLTSAARPAQRLLHSCPDTSGTSTPATSWLQRCVWALRWRIRCDIRVERSRAPPEHENASVRGTTVPLVRSAPAGPARRAG